jgi:prepilin-type N-terminal cleavage/methylation domain-containing protein
MRVPHKNGFSLVEIVIGVAVFSFALMGLITAFIHYFAASREAGYQIQAAYLLEESLEAVKTLRDVSWSSDIAPLSTSSSYYLSFSTSTDSWSLTTSPNMIDSFFARTVTFGDVMRATTGNDISTSTSGVTYDPNTKLVNAQVSWLTGYGTTSSSLSMYMANLFGN